MWEDRTADFSEYLILRKIISHLMIKNRTKKLKTVLNVTHCNVATNKPSGSFVSQNQKLHILCKLFQNIFAKNNPLMSCELNQNAMNTPLNTPVN